MSVDQVFGYTGCILLGITLIPQIYKSYKSKSMDDVSFSFIILQNITCIIFIIYGSLLEQTPIILANCIIGLQCLVLFTMKIIYKGDNNYSTVIPTVNRLYVSNI
jgi:MtN3 and saliva related transmembrane protein